MELRINSAGLRPQSESNGLEIALMLDPWLRRRIVDRIFKKSADWGLSQIYMPRLNSLDIG